MLMPFVATELARVAIQKISEMKLDDAVHAIKTLQKATGGGAMLLPGIGVFTAGVAVGAGLGVLLAPRSGNETRKALRENIDRRMQSVRARFAERKAQRARTNGSVTRSVPEA